MPWPYKVESLDRVARSEVGRRADRLRWAGNKMVHDLPVMEADYDGIKVGHTALRELADVLR